jgi:hypothetical protein
MGIKIQVSPLMMNERHGWCSPELVASLMLMAQDSRIELLDFQPAVNFPSSQQARNYLCKQFMESSCDWLLMLDNDTVPVNPENGYLVNYLDMVHETELSTNWQDKGILVGAPVPVYRSDSGMAYINSFLLTSDGYYPHSWGWLKQAAENKLPGLVKVDAVGTGVALLNRKALELVSLTSPRGVYVARPRDPDGSTILGEDLKLCQRLKQAGGRVYCHVPSLSDHAHTVPLGKLASSNFYFHGLEALGIRTPYPLNEFSMTLPALQRLHEEIIEKVGGYGQYLEVVEAGSGASTLVIAKALKHCRDSGKVTSSTSLEQDEKRAAALIDALRAENLPGLVRVTEQEKDGGFWVGGVSLYLPEHRIHVLVVDGPGPTSICPTPNRVRIIKDLGHQLDQGALVVIDDAYRDTEQATIRDLVSLGKLENVSYVGRTMFGSWVRTPNHTKSGAN